nr:MAG TPA: hypothetical protein [Caudoviricetes sp.]
MVLFLYHFPPPEGIRLTFGRGRSGVQITKKGSTQ